MVVGWGSSVDRKASLQNLYSGQAPNIHSAQLNSDICTHLVAKPLSTLSAYLTTVATIMPPAACKKMTM